MRMLSRATRIWIHFRRLGVAEEHSSSVWLVRCNDALPRNARDAWSSAVAKSRWVDDGVRRNVASGRGQEVVVARLL